MVFLTHNSIFIQCNAMYARHSTQKQCNAPSLLTHFINLNINIKYLSSLVCASVNILITVALNVLQYQNKLLSLSVSKFRTLPLGLCVFVRRIIKLSMHNTQWKWTYHLKCISKTFHWIAHAHTHRERDDG